MGAVINIGTDGLVDFTNRLEQMHRSNLPVAVRQTLNKAAFDMRSKSLPKTYAQAFTVRDKNFLRSRTRVAPAKGFNIKTMQAKTGLHGSDKTTTDLAKQSTGGRIGSRAFIPLATARTSNTEAKKVRRKARLSRVVFNNRIRKGDGQRMIRAAHAEGKGGHILYGDTLFQIKSLKKRKNNHTWVDLRPLYSYKENRKANITEKQDYIQRAAREQGLQLEKNFVHFASKRLRG